MVLISLTQFKEASTNTFYILRQTAMTDASKWGIPDRKLLTRILIEQHCLYKGKNLVTNDKKCEILFISG